MRIFWWQAGLHIEPQSDEERSALFVLSESLDISRIKMNQPSSGSGFRMFNPVQLEDVAGGNLSDGFLQRSLPDVDALSTQIYRDFPKLLLNLERRRAAWKRDT